MAIKDIIARGVGFNPGSTRFIVTHGLELGPAAEVVFPEEVVLGRSARKKITYSGTRELDDHSLSPHPITVFSVYRDRAGNLQEAAGVTPFPVVADLAFGEGLEELQQTMDALLLERRLTNLLLSRWAGEELK